MQPQVRQDYPRDQEGHKSDGRNEEEGKGIHRAADEKGHQEEKGKKCES
jgi:hypothetical protein